MSFSKEKRYEIKRFIVSSVEKHPRDLIKFSSEHFVCKVTNDLDESQVWLHSVLPFIPKLKDNVAFICNYGFTEMLNNVKDHSSSDIVYIGVAYDAAKIKFAVLDRGIGIFRKIQEDFGLANKNDAIIELTKGRLTSDPENHTGEGIFFTSRLFDSFSILSENLYFHGHDDDDWLLERDDYDQGTSVLMSISRGSVLEPNDVFNKFATPELDDYGFSRTHFPLKLLQHEGESLVSRSQAKRVISRLGQFKEVILDFDGITRIGQGFADEIFRVFKNSHPEIRLIPINFTESIEQTINHVLSISQKPLF